MNSISKYGIINNVIKSKQKYEFQIALRIQYIILNLELEV